MPVNIKVLENLDSVLLALHSGGGYSFFDEHQRIMTNTEFLSVVLPDTATIAIAYPENLPRNAMTMVLIREIIRAFKENE